MLKGKLLGILKGKWLVMLLGILKGKLGILKGNPPPPPPPPPCPLSTFPIVDPITPPKEPNEFPRDAGLNPGNL